MDFGGSLKWTFTFAFLLRTWRQFDFVPVESMESLAYQPFGFYKTIAAHTCSLRGPCTERRRARQRAAHLHSEAGPSETSADFPLPETQKFCFIQQKLFINIFIFQQTNSPLLLGCPDLYHPPGRRKKNSFILVIQTTSWTLLHR